MRTPNALDLGYKTYKDARVYLVLDMRIEQCEDPGPGDLQARPRMRWPKCQASRGRCTDRLACTICRRGGDDPHRERTK